MHGGLTTHRSVPPIQTPLIGKEELGTSNPEPNDALPHTDEQCTQVLSQASTIPLTEQHGFSVASDTRKGALTPHRSVRPLSNFTQW